MGLKKRIVLLTLVIFTVSLIITFIDALVTVVYDIIPKEVPSTNFTDLVLYGPVWWKINAVISALIIAIGIISYLLGTVKTRSIYKPHYFDIIVVIFTFLIISASGLGDAISQTFIEILRGNTPGNWIVYEWWWTKYIPLPLLLTLLSGLVYPTGVTMLVSSAIGVILLVFLWYYYFKIYEFKGRRSKEERLSLRK